VTKSKRNELIVGLVFVTGLSLLGAYTIVIKDIGFGGTKDYVVDFPRVYGLKEGDPVRVEGFEVGEVTSLRILPDGQVRSVLNVSSDVEIYREGSQVKVTPFSPLGGRVVEITRGVPTEARGTYTAYDDDMSPERVEEVVIEGTAEGELLQTLNSLVETNSAAITSIVDNLEHVSVQLTRTDNVLGYLVNDREAAERIDSVVVNMSSASGRLDRILARVEAGEGVVGGLVTDGTPLGQDVEGAVAAGRGALQHAESILGRAERGESALGVFVSDHPQVKGDVEGIVADVKHITGEVSDPESPGTLSRVVHDGRLYDGAADTFENLGVLTERMSAGEGVMGVLFEEEAGDDARRTLKNLAEVTDAVNDPDAGTLGLLVHDDVLRGRIGRVAEEIERLVVEFRDSLEDVREQAPVNAFIGAVFAAF